MYHNFAHGVSVMQSFYIISKELVLKNIKLDSEIIFVALIACISHDVNHKGKNNAYHIA